MKREYYKYTCDTCGQEIDENRVILVEDYSEIIFSILEDADDYLTDDTCFCSIKCLLTKIMNIMEKSRKAEPDWNES